MKKLLLLFFILFTTIASAQVVLNEICPANADINYDPDYYNFSGWIEIYNGGTSAVNVSGYYLSDKQNQPLKWKIPNGVYIPGNGFLLIWCDEMNSGRHTNFSLNATGEDVVFSNTAGILLDKISFPKQHVNISYGRSTNGSGTWGFLTTPTPNATNSTTVLTHQTEKPTFENVGGRYTTQAQITLKHTNTQAEIRYTLDGSEPTVASLRYSIPISIATTRTVKAKAFINGELPSATETQTYFINEHTFGLPVVSISTKPAYLNDNQIGIYVDGTNGVTGNCQDTPKNWNRDWDRHAVFEYFDKNGNRLFNQSIDISIAGGCSRAQAQKSFAIKARNKYGSNIMNHRFFDSKSLNQFGGLLLRNSGNDFNMTQFRDAFMQNVLIGQMDVDYQDYQPTILYVNGQYMGIQNMREKMDADYIDSNYSLNDEEIDLLESYGYAKEGTSDAYTTYMNTLSSMNRTTPAAFDYINANIDVQEYINYLVAQIYYANTDWPGNNIKYWRSRSSDGKFRWMLYDTDFGFAIYNDNDAYHATLNFATSTNGPDWPNPPWSTQHIRMVLENPIFKSRLIQTMNTALNTTFHPTRVIGIINQFQTRIASEMPYHKQRWWGDMGNWNYEVQRLRNFATARNQFMRQHMADFFGLSNTVNISTAVKQGAGKFRINEVVSDANQTQPYFAGLPITIEPVAAPGYIFKEWKITKQNSTAVPLIVSGSAWKYFDQGYAPANWNAESFDDNTWPQGNEQLGYGESDEQTTVSFGPDPANKFITTYFRKSFSVADTVDLVHLSGSMLIDDGAVVYLNGIEVQRYNMPAVPIINNTLALQASEENVYTSFTIPKGLIKPGVNVVAVEVHQNSAQSSDLSFALSLETLRLGSTTESSSTTPIQNDVANTNIQYEAYFEASGTFITGIVINEISASSIDVVDQAGEAEDWIELYNTGTQPVNLAGLYITDNFNNRTKHKLLAGTGNEMIIEPGGYKVLWADEDIHQGARHLDFKLSADGEAVGLYQVMGEHILTISEVVFQAQPLPGVWTRIPNATGPFIFAQIGTPSAFNEIITSVEEELTVRVYPNPVTDYATIKSEAPLHTVTLSDCFGRVLHRLNYVSDHSLSMQHYPAGIYILRLESSTRTKTIKLLKQ